MKPPVHRLVVGERVVSRCDDGPLEAEYALFERSEVLLSATSGQGVREEGYMTTAGFARARLYEALITADLAYESYTALRTRNLRPLARSPAVTDVLPQLGPFEIFEGGRFFAQRSRYEGVWLDLEVLAGACPLPGAAIVFQALHLLLVLEEVTEDVPVRLLTAEGAIEGRPGERTWKKVDLDAAQRLPAVLREMEIPTERRRAPCDEAEVREEILRNLRARITAAAVAQPRLSALASTIARTGSTPPSGIVIEPAPPTQRMASRPANPSPLPPRSSSGSARPSSRPPPRDAATASANGSADPEKLLDTLREQKDILRGDEHLRQVATSLSSLVDRSGFVPELAILAARAWLAAGESGYARHYATRIVEDANISDELRIAALEIIDSSPKNEESMRPPPPEAIKPSRVIVLSEEGDRPAPAGASLPPMSPLSPPATPLPSQTTPFPLVQAPTGAASFIVAPLPASAPAPTSRPEIVETLSLPPGLSDDILPPGATPRDPMQTRVAMTRLSRELGRDYRLAYGTTLKVDVVAIDAMQRHLRRRFADNDLDEKHARKLQGELTRHGALMSEILARLLGAEWTDVASDEPGHWSMIVPPAVTVWPIGRVYRYYGQGHREADLVAFFMDLESATRRRR